MNGKEPSLFAQAFIALLPLLSLIPLSSLSQEKEKDRTSDSLRAVVEESASDTDRMDALNKLSERKWRKGDFQPAIELAKRALRLAKRSDHSKGIAEAYNNLGIVHSQMGNYPKSVEKWKDAIEAYKKIGNEHGVASIHNNLGITKRKQGRYDEALEEYLASLEIYERLGKKEGMALCRNNIGIVLKMQGHLDRAISQYRKSLKLYEEMGKKSGIAATHTNIGALQKEKGEYEAAMESQRKALRIRRALGQKQGIATNYKNIGTLFLNKAQEGVEMGPDSIFAEEPIGRKNPNTDSAETYLKKCLALYKELGVQEGEVHAMITLGKTELFKGNEPEAIHYLQRSASLADSLGTLPVLFKAHLGLSRAYSRKGDPRKAYQHHVEYARTKDRVNDQKTREKVARMEEKYKAEKRQRKIEVLEKKRKLDRARAERRRTILYSVGGGLGGVLILLFVLYTRFRVIRRQRNLIRAQKQEVDQAYQKLEEAHESLQEKNKEIRDSIDYASFIQGAILPSEAEMEHCFGGKGESEKDPPYFVMFKPQATVSGDFYWCHRDAQEAIWAAVDCTGHGVPGAFMSMIGNSLLDEVVIEKGERDPGRILDLLREGIVEKLGKEGRKDGMDMALCSLRWENGRRILRFAGANNPLYLIREGIAGSMPLVSIHSSRNGTEEIPPSGDERTKTEQERVTPFRTSPHGIELRGDKQAVGFGEDEASPFTTIEIEVERNDRLYSFSDGYADQFGGPKGKKYRYKPFKEKLVELHKQPMSEQKKLLEQNFEDWRGDREQVDDVLVMGVRVG